MGHYNHLTIEEQETILVMQTKGDSIRNILTALDRLPSTVSREIRRNTTLQNRS